MLIEGGPEHPAVYHMLDVAAVAERLIVAEAFKPPVRDALILLTALHDLGKIGARFRAALKENKKQGDDRHWKVSEALLWQHRALLMDRLGVDVDVHRILYAATAGHHGEPPKGSLSPNDKNFRGMMLRAGPAAKSDARDAILAFADLWSKASLDSLNGEAAIRLSWWLPGLVSTSDWIGSNIEWFPLRGPGLTLAKKAYPFDYGTATCFTDGLMAGFPDSGGIRAAATRRSVRSRKDRDSGGLGVGAAGRGGVRARVRGRQAAVSVRSRYVAGGSPRPRPRSRSKEVCRRRRFHRKTN